MGIIGSAVSDANYRLRFFVIITLGILATGSVFYWKAVILSTSEYQDMPLSHQVLEAKQANKEKRLEISKPATTSPEKQTNTKKR